jgi:hypothetical protein
MDAQARGRNNPIVTVVRFEAWCDYVTEDEYRDELSRSSLPRHTVEEALRDFRCGYSFRVQEFAELADGRRLPLGDERGFSGNAYVTGRSEPVDPWPFTTLAGLEADVRCTVLPDDDEPEDEHPWAWLAERLHGHGVDAAVEQLKRLPYDVVFSRRLLGRVLAHTLRRLDH